MRTNQEYLIRPAEIADLESVTTQFDQYRQFYEREPNLSQSRKFIEDRFLNNDALVFVAEKPGNQIVGICVMYPSLCSLALKPIYILHDLYVTAAFRNSGAARGLLRHAVKVAADNGAIRLDLTTAKDNLIAQSLYESENWKKDEIFLTYSYSI